MSDDGKHDRATVADFKKAMAEFDKPVKRCRHGTPIRDDGVPWCGACRTKQQERQFNR